MTRTWRPATLGEYRARWELTPKGASFATPSSALQPVATRGGRRAMLKVALVEEEARGSTLLAWFEGHGAAPVLAHDAHAALIAWAGGTRSLTAYAEAGRDDEATRVLAQTGCRLHAASGVHPAPRGLTSLDTWFSDLFAREERGGQWARSAGVARELLATPADVVVLHGDLHHGNVLDFGDDGWLAIDPKHLSGNRVFDFANILCNPAPRTAERLLARRVEIIADVARIGRDELLAWTTAWTALSAAWYESTDAARAASALRIGARAARLRKAAGIR